MRPIVRALALVMFLAFLTPKLVLAGTDYISDAAQALQHAPVYVAPDTEGTDNDTAGKLQARLSNDDNIVLVMLPAAAEKELNLDINTIASRLSEKLENKRIIGLSVGNNVVGYGPNLPSGVAADQMRRAKSVSNDPITALGTFAQNMHNWEAENPQPQPQPFDTPNKSSGGLPVGAWVGIALGIFLCVIFVAGISLAAFSSSETKEKTHFKAPDQVKDLLDKIAKERRQIADAKLSQTLYQMCEDIEKYFASSSRDKKRDSIFFRDRLSDVLKVVTKYIEVQNAPRYFTNPRDELAKGKTSIVDFSDYVLKSIQDGNTADLVDYTVNTKILQAQRFR